MAMSYGSCASRINTAFENYLKEIKEDADKQFQKYQEEEDANYQKYLEEHPIKERKKKLQKATSNTTATNNNAENIGIKSSIPKSSQTAPAETTEPEVEEEEEVDTEPYQRSEYNFTPKTMEDFWLQVAKELDNEFQKATPSMTNVDITTPAGSLKFNIKEASVANDPTNALEIATKVSEYWAKTIQPTGTPVSGKQITVVVNTAATIISPLTSALLSMGLSSAQGDNFSKFTNTIITQVKTIVWTVTEIDPTIAPYPMVYNFPTVTIS
jgi:hypothetical protein